MICRKHGVSLLPLESARVIHPTHSLDDVVALSRKNDVQRQLLEGCRKPIDGAVRLSGRDDFLAANLERLVLVGQEPREKTTESVQTVLIALLNDRTHETSVRRGFGSKSEVVGADGANEDTLVQNVEGGDTKLNAEIRRRWDGRVCDELDTLGALRVAGEVRVDDRDCAERG